MNTLNPLTGFAIFIGIYLVAIAIRFLKGKLAQKINQ